MARGTLRIYLGAAPGVGKTVAMLEEGHRRLNRGADVSVAFVETYGRAYTARKLEGLPCVPRRAMRDCGADFEELDLEAVLECRPSVALVDELAHVNAPGAGHERRWQDVEVLLDAGIDVISTVNIQHLESLNDVVGRITGVPQWETVPDAVVRAADQIELVDMSPEALRKRLAHGNVYPPERVDAALGNFFRVGNLTALRELALLWLADRVEEGLQRYREQHGITGVWETKERVVVALTGGPEGDTLIRRAARIASRTVGGEVLAVHVAPNAGLPGPGVAQLAGQRLLVESLGGSYHSILGDSVPEALLDFARRVDATQIVLGTSRRNRLVAAVTGPGTGETVTRLSGPIDVHLVTHEQARGHGPGLPRLTRGLTTRRRLFGLALAAVLLPVLTVICTEARETLRFGADLPLYLLVVVLTSLVGGFYPAVVSAVIGSLLLNYFFVEPLHTFSISEPSNLLAVVIFLLIAVLVSQVVDLAARRTALAARATAEAETLSTFAGSLLRGEQALPALLERTCESFAMDAVSLLRHDVDARTWAVVGSAGVDPPGAPGGPDAEIELADDLHLAWRGRALSAADHRVLGAFAANIVVAYRQRQLAEAARAAEPLAESDRQRTALLNAVSHDLRTPIASAKAAVSSLRADEVQWGEADRRELLTTAEEALDRLTDLVTNLLDLSRLQVGSLPVVPSVIGLDDVVARALDHVADVQLDVDVPDDLPEVVADAGLLERVIANVVQNAVRHTPDRTPVRIAGSAHADRVEVRVIDRGPGLAADDVDQVFRPFQRTDDAPRRGNGVGLGLAIARGFTEAMGGTLTVEPTPGGGATFVVALQQATRS